MVVKAHPDNAITVVTEGGPHIWAIVNAISRRLGPVAVILETPESKAQLLRRRAHKQGWISVAGQIGTMVLTRVGKRFFSSRADRLIAETGLETAPLSDQMVIHVPTANSPEFLDAIENLKPRVVLLAGCRLLTRETLASIPCPVLNYHAGIAPKYRGMNGGYWALATGDTANFGTTVHLVDAGVDTGGVLRQVRGKPRPGDNIMLYALRQAAFSSDICIAAIEDVLAGKAETIDPGLPSKQWYHPTIWFYLWTGLTRNVW
jgi:methionyl-tRNA formyltransferase